MTVDLEKYLMEPTPFELRVGDIAGKLAEDAQILGKYIKLSENTGKLIGNLFELSPNNAAGIINAGLNYSFLKKDYEEFIASAPWKRIKYYGKSLNFDQKGVGILGYRLGVVREYFTNIMKNPIFKIAIQKYRDATDEFFNTFS